ncbi:MAG: CBM9 family sugar-binding protein [Pseudomonadales bacterium]
MSHSNTHTLWLTLVTVLLSNLVSPVYSASSHYEGRTHYLAPLAKITPNVDGVADESIWKKAKWQAIDNRWLGPEYSNKDFSGRFKVVWTEKKLYILGEFVDDTLLDIYRNPLQQYWDDDCLEIFLDENHSGGEHQYNHNAFAYHVSLDNQAIDIGTDKKPHNYSHHVDSRWMQQGNKIIWELGIDIYTDSYQDGSENNQPVSLSAGKTMGLMLAYCDNDGSKLRENFIGSESVPGGDKDRGWIDAGLFGTLQLVDKLQ